MWLQPLSFSLVLQEEKEAEEREKAYREKQLKAMQGGGAARFVRGGHGGMPMMGMMGMPGMGAGMPDLKKLKVHTAS